MIKLRPFVSLVAGVALVAGLTAVGAAPAQAANTVLPAGGTTAIVFDAPVLEALDGAGVTLSTRSSASINPTRGSVRFPVTGVVAESDAILHSGALVFTRGSVEDGVVVLGQPTIRTNDHGIWPVTAKAILGEGTFGRLDVFRVVSIRERSFPDGRIVVEGVIRLVDNPGIADGLNETLGLDGVFVAGMRLGSVRSVILPGPVT